MKKRKMFLKNKNSHTHAPPAKKTHLASEEKDFLINSQYIREKRLFSIGVH